MRLAVRVPQIADSAWLADAKARADCHLVRNTESARRCLRALGARRASPLAQRTQLELRRKPMPLNERGDSRYVRS
jgi:hypothetical protein